MRLHYSDVVEYVSEGPLAFSHGITAIYIFLFYFKRLSVNP